MLIHLIPPVMMGVLVLVGAVLVQEIEKAETVGEVVTWIVIVLLV
tara:strand:- start:375 stop:509 length:135 start_codon:yes stop_codon:yes gene_type:complete